MPKHEFGVTGYAWEVTNKALFTDNWFYALTAERLPITLIDLQFREPTNYHYHQKTDEFFRFDDLGTVVIEGQKYDLYKGRTLYLPAGLKHKIIPVESEILRATLVTIPRFDPSDEYVVEEQH